MQIDKLDWSSLRKTEGENIAIDFDGRPQHLVLIPFEVLEDGLATTNEDALQSAECHKTQVLKAIETALHEGAWRDLVRIGTGQKLRQLWISRAHFGK